MIKSNHADWWASVPLYWKDWINWIGFYSLDGEQNYLFFLPYLLLFAGSILLKSRFNSKLELEMKQLVFEEDDIVMLTESNFIEERPDG